MSNKRAPIKEQPQEQIKQEFNPELNYTANPTEVFSLNWNELSFAYNTIVAFTSTQEFQHKLMEARTTNELWNQRILLEHKLRQGVATGAIYPAKQEETKNG